MATRNLRKWAYQCTFQQVCESLCSCRETSSSLFALVPIITKFQQLLLKTFNTSISSQFHQRYTYKYFIRTSFFYVHVTRKSCQNATFVQFFCTFNVDEIDTWSSKKFKFCNQTALSWCSFYSCPKNKFVFFTFIHQNTVKRDLTTSSE